MVDEWNVKWGASPLAPDQSPLFLLRDLKIAPTTASGPLKGYELLVVCLGHSLKGPGIRLSGKATLLWEGGGEDGGVQRFRVLCGFRHRQAQVSRGVQDRLGPLKPWLV